MDYNIKTGDIIITKADNGFIIKRMKGLLFLESYTVYIAKDTEDLINVLKKICSEGDDNGK